MKYFITIFDPQGQTPAMELESVEMLSSSSSGVLTLLCKECGSDAPERLGISFSGPLL